VSGCSTVSATVSYSCPGVARVVANAGDGDDRLDASDLVTATATLRGGAGRDYLGAGDQADVLEGDDGDDSLTGGAGDSTLRGGAGNDLLYGGAGSELLDGGADTDTLQGNAGVDVYRGGDGTDTAYFAEARADAPVTISASLDGLANDGPAGQGDLIEPSVENVTASSEGANGAVGAVALAGDAGPNRLEVTKGAATLTGGAGADVLLGGAQDDLIDARDGGVDSVTCRGGQDTVLADAADVVAADCESVTRAAAPVTPVHAPTPAPDKPKTRPAVHAFTPSFITRIALRGPALGRLDGIGRIAGLRARSTVTLRCLSGCPHALRMVVRAGAKPARLRLVVRRGLVLRGATRVELRVSRSGERTRSVRYRFVRRGGAVIPKQVSSGIART
jgi:hypothetical protein